MPLAWTVAAVRPRQSFLSVQIHVRVLAIKPLTTFSKYIDVSVRLEKIRAVCQVALAVEAHRPQFRGALPVL